MSVQVTINGITPSSVPTNGWYVEYRIKGSVGAYTQAPGNPYMSEPIIFTTSDPDGTLYEGHIWRDCGALDSSKYNWQTVCDCTGSGGGYVAVGSGNDQKCQKTETISPTITSSNYCLAESKNGAYSNYGARIYSGPFMTNGNDTVYLPVGSSDSHIAYVMTSNPQWQNTSPNVLGPMNRNGVWIDSNCNGTKDSLSAGVQCTISAQYVNTGPSKTVYIGIAGDNDFRLVVNGVLIIDSSLSGISSGNNVQFKFWHIFPVTLQTGLNLFNAVATGDGSVDDTIAMVVYNNTAAQIAAATSDASLNIIFGTASLIDEHIDVATCPDTYSLDTSGGQGNYICKKLLEDVCNQ